MLEFIGRRPRSSGAPGWLLAGALLCGSAGVFAFGLSHEELGRLVKAVDKQGSRVTLPRDVASVLQLKPSQFAPDIKEAAWQDENGNKHGFGPLNDGSGFFMFNVRPSEGQTVYVLDADLHLLHAGRTLLKGAPMIALPDNEAQRELDEEFRRWSKVLSPEGPPTAPKPSGEPVPFPFKPQQPTKP